jgi:hypothetical protein
MTGDRTLRDEILETIRSGRLPDRPAERTWAGRGCGALCVVCSRPVDPDELEYELEFIAADGSKPAVYHVHNACYWAWETERRNLELKRAAAAPIELSGSDPEGTVAEDEREAPDGEGST